GVVTIRAGKLNKAREVPLHPTTSQALQAHGRQRDQLAPAAQTPAFFVNVRGNRLASRRVPAVFAQLCQDAGIGTVPGGRNPRPRAPRHSFPAGPVRVVSRAGRAAPPRLPLLSTSLGPVAPVSTYGYLQAAPELLALAAGRLENPLGDLP